MKVPYAVRKKSKVGAYWKYLCLGICLLGQSLILRGQADAQQTKFTTYPNVQKWVETTDFSNELLDQLVQLEADTTTLVHLDQHLNDQQFYAYLNQHRYQLDSLVNASNRSGYLSYLAHIGTDLEDFYKVFRHWSFGKRKWSWLPYFANLKKKFLVQLSGYEQLSYEEILAQVLAQPAYRNMDNTDAYMLFAYTTAFYYRKLNRWLRNEENLGQIVEIKALLDQTLTKLNSIPPNTTCYRSLKIADEAQLKAFINRHAAALKRNAPVTYKEFLSVATKLEDSFVGRDGYNINMYIQTSENSKCKSIHDFAWGKYHFETLSEDLFMSGTQFQVIKIVPFGKNVHYIFLKEVQ
ncbi:MAG: hypothetical protein AAGF77_14730 [Bacteroidota bacterium]